MAKSLTIPLRPAVRVALGKLAEQAGRGGSRTHNGPITYATDLLEMAILDRFNQVFGVPVNRFLKLRAGR